MREGNSITKGVYTKYLIYEEMDRTTFRKIYWNWVELSNNLQAIGGKRIGLPEGLAEGLFALETGSVRITGFNRPFDCYKQVGYFKPHKGTWFLSGFGETR